MCNCLRVTEGGGGGRREERGEEMGLVLTEGSEEGEAPVRFLTGFGPEIPGRGPFGYTQHMYRVQMHDEQAEVKEEI